MAGAAILIAGIITAIVPAVASELDDLGRSARQGLDEVVEWLTAGPL